MEEGDSNYAHWISQAFHSLQHVQAFTQFKANLMFLMQCIVHADSFYTKLLRPKFLVSVKYTKGGNPVSSITPWLISLVLIKFSRKVTVIGYAVLIPAALNKVTGLGTTVISEMVHMPITPPIISTSDLCSPSPPSSRKLRRIRNSPLRRSKLCRWRRDQKRDISM